MTLRDIEINDEAIALLIRELEAVTLPIPEGVRKRFDDGKAFFIRQLRDLQCRCFACVSLYAGACDPLS